MSNLQEAGGSGCLGQWFPTLVDHGSVPEPLIETWVLNPLQQASAPFSATPNSCQQLCVSVCTGKLKGERGVGDYHLMLQKMEGGERGTHQAHLLVQLQGRVGQLLNWELVLSHFLDGFSGLFYPLFGIYKLIPTAFMNSPAPHHEATTSLVPRSKRTGRSQLRARLQQGKIHRFHNSRKLNLPHPNPTRALLLPTC